MTSCIRLTQCLRALFISLESDFLVIATIAVMDATRVRWQLFLFSIRFSLRKHKCSEEFFCFAFWLDSPLLSDTMPGNGRTRLDGKKILTECLDVAAVHTMKVYSVMPLLIETLVHVTLGHYLQQRLKKRMSREVWHYPGILLMTNIKDTSVPVCFILWLTKTYKQTLCKHTKSGN